MLRLSRFPLFPLIVALESTTRGERPRVPEPMVMDDPAGAAEYDRAGEALQVPVHHFNALALSRLLPEGGTLVDLGCGSGRLLARLARGRPDARLIGLDLSEPMLEAGRELLEQEGVADRVELRIGDITKFGEQLPETPDVVSCNFTLHQLPDPDLVRRCLEAIRMVRDRDGSAAYVFDLVRLRNPRSWPAMMSLLKMPGKVFLQDSIASERAAFTFAELRDLLDESGPKNLQHVRARPLGEYQVHWAPQRGAQVPGTWQDVPLPPGTGLATNIVRASFPRAMTRT